MSEELQRAARIINGIPENFENSTLVEKVLPQTDFIMGQYFQLIFKHMLEQYPTTLEVYWYYISLTSSGR
jgi:hypothetical protein